MNLKTLVLTTASAVVLGAAAQAASVTISITEFGDRSSAVNAQFNALSGLSLRAYEDFESYSANEPNGPYDATPGINPTEVGDFTAILPEGGGGSNRDPGDQALIRSNANENNNGQPNFGRHDADFGWLATPIGDPNSFNFIDSNDNTGIMLNTLSSGQSFDYMSFILTDYDDVGSLQFDLMVHGLDLTGDVVFDNGVTQGNGDIFLVQLSFTAAVSNIDVSMTIDPGDGFGADSFALAAIPLPAPALLLIGALGALGLRARKKARA